MPCLHVCVFAHLFCQCVQIKSVVCVCVVQCRRSGLMLEVLRIDWVACRARLAIHFRQVEGFCARRDLSSLHHHIICLIFAFAIHGHRPFSHFCEPFSLFHTHTHTAPLLLSQPSKANHQHSETAAAQFYTHAFSPLPASSASQHGPTTTTAPIPQSQHSTTHHAQLSLPQRAGSGSTRQRRDSSNINSSRCVFGVAAELHGVHAMCLWGPPAATARETAAGRFAASTVLCMRCHALCCHAVSG